MAWIKIESVTLKRLIKSYLLIIIIPLTITATVIFSYFYIQMKNNMIKLSYDEMGKIYNTYIENSKKIGTVYYTLKSDIEFLEFVTSEEYKPSYDLYWFKRYLTGSYEKMMSLSTENITMRVFTENKNMRDVYPLLYVVDKIKNGKDNVKLEKEGTVLSLYKTIEFIPSNVLVEFKVNLSNLFNVDKERNYFILNNDAVFPLNKISDIETDIDYGKISGGETGISFHESKKYIYAVRYLKGLDIHIGEAVSKAELYKFRNIFMIYIFIFMAVIIISLYIIARKIMENSFSQLDGIIKAVKEIKSGNFEAVIPIIDKKSEFYLLADQIDSMRQKIDELISDMVIKETSVKDSQIKALQSQINAHFLQNTLESIKMMALIDGNHNVSQSLTNLGHLLRYGMDWRSPYVLLSDELEYVTKYTELYTIRLDFHVELKINIEPGLENLRIPKMIIQPLVENSIEHGIVPKDSDGEIIIDVAKFDDGIVISVYDNGIGAETANIKESGHTSGIGLKNIENRLKIAFGNMSRIEVESVKDNYTIVKLILIYGEGEYHV